MALEAREGRGVRRALLANSRFLKLAARSEFGYIRMNKYMTYIT